MLGMALMMAGRWFRFVACGLFTLVLWGWTGVKKSFAVTVDFNPSTGNLTVSGDGSGDNLQVSQHSSTQINVGGSIYTLDDSGTVAGVTEILISGQGGDDTIGLNPTGFTNLGDVGGTDITLYGGDGNDSIVGTDLNDCLTGGEGNDTLRGCDGSDSLLGDNGNDSLDAGNESDKLWGGAGNAVRRRRHGFSLRGVG